MKANFDRIHFEGYCIYPPNSFFLMKIHIVYFKTVPWFYDTPLRWLSMLWRKWKHREKILYRIWNISENKAPFGKRWYRFGEKPCMYHYQKEQDGVEHRKTLGHFRSINTNMTNHHQNLQEYQWITTKLAHPGLHNARSSLTWKRKKHA